MACLGVHFALDQSTLDALLSHAEDEDRRNYLQAVIEEEWLVNQSEWTAESGKAWDATHRALTDGNLGWENGAYPLNHVILGGRSLYSADDYIMSLKSWNVVRDVAEALNAVTQVVLRKRYFAIDPDRYGSAIDQEDFDHTWSSFENIRELFKRASAASRHILFTVDQ